MAEGVSKPIRVVVVDDNEMIRDRLYEILSGAGMRVVGTCEDGMAAVGAALTLKPDVITMDVSMPRVDGLEALRVIMATCPTPVVVLSWMGSQATVLRRRARHLGAAAVLSKTFDKDGQPDLDRIAKRIIRAVTRAARQPVHKIKTHPVPAPEIQGQNVIHPLASLILSPTGQPILPRRPWRWTS